VLTLISPAKALDFSRDTNGLVATEPRFVKDSAVLLKRCKQLSTRSLRKLMDLSEPLAQLNRDRFQEMSLPSTPENAKPCVMAFDGDVYHGLDAPSLSDGDLSWAQERLRILSGLYGLLRPFDLIQPYRLEMGTRLSNTRGKNLYDFWGKRLAVSLNAESEALPGTPVLNLASNEYAKAVPMKHLAPPMVTAVFQEERDGHAQTIGFVAKRARGLMARFVIENRIDEPEALKEFAEEDYGYRPDLSEDDRLVFTRPRP